MAIDLDSAEDSIYPVSQLEALVTSPNLKALMFLQVLTQLEPTLVSIKRYVGGRAIYLNLVERKIFIESGGPVPAVYIDSQNNLEAYAEHVKQCLVLILPGLNLRDPSTWEDWAQKYKRSVLDLRSVEIGFATESTVAPSLHAAVGLIRENITTRKDQTVERFGTKYREIIDAFKAAFKYKRDRGKFLENFSTSTLDRIILGNMTDNLDNVCESLNVPIILNAVNRQRVKGLEVYKNCRIAKVYERYATSDDSVVNSALDRCLLLAAAEVLRDMPKKKK